MLVALVLSAPLACKGVAGSSGSSSGSGATPADGAPLSLNWEQPYKLVATGTKGEATFFATKDAAKPPLKLEGSFHGFPKGTKVKFGTDEGTLGDGSYWSTLVDIKGALLKQSLDDLKGPIDVDLEVSITPPGAPTATVKLQRQNLKDSLRFALLKARDGGVSFGADDEANGKPRGAAVLASYSDLDFVGSAKVLKELDWIVVAEDQPQPRISKSCAFKQGATTLKVFDANVTAYNRRTGEKLSSGVIKASDECPMFAMVNKQDNTTKNTVATKDVVAWARDALAKGPAPQAQAQAQRAHVEPSTQNVMH
ncbi:MAG TPA: hypothetical protein VHP33_30500 [Polyangiaceae bacterium]|nr:hypothetical protein [Polyangiaceae bacterium]